jgi:ABC-2 type transport system permease protein
MNAVAAAFWSEWPKLRRRSLLLGGVGTLLAFTILVTTLGIERATNGAQFERHGFRVSIQQLSQPDGLVHGITSASTLLGIVVLGIFAAAFGSEYSHGTLRALLVREPRRLRLLGGKLGALLVFGAAAVVLACAVSVATAFALGPSKGIDTSAWTSSQGLHDLWVALGHVVLSCLGFGILGAALAVVLRSPVVSLAVGVAWLLPAEAIIDAAWSDGARWLPGRLLDAVANGGSDSASFSRAGVLLVLYLAAVVVATGTLFRRRDVLV